MFPLLCTISLRTLLIKYFRTVPVERCRESGLCLKKIRLEEAEITIHFNRVPYLKCANLFCLILISNPNIFLVFCYPLYAHVLYSEKTN